jgi:phage I-like protein
MPQGTKTDESFTLSRPIALNEGAEPVDAFCLFTAGEIDTLKGKFLFDDVAARDVMNAYADYGNELPIDYDHAMADPMCGPQERIAAGWFNLEVREGALWAVNVRWTPRAAKALGDREWRYMSPWFLATSDPRRITRVLNCALTNTPATKHLTPIAASQSVTDTPRDAAQENDTMKQLLIALGLGAEASEAEALVALSKREDASKALLTATDKKSLGEALAQVSVWKEQAAESVGLKAALASEKKTREDATALSAIDKALDEKRITPAQVDVAKKVYADHGSAALGVFLSAFVTAQVDTNKPTAKPAGDAESKALTETEKRIAHSLGISLEDALKNKLSIGGAA